MTNNKLKTNKTNNKNMKYLVRAIKYFLMLVVIFVVVTFFMRFTGSLELSFEEQMALFMANRGALKLAFLVVLSATYPLFGYITRFVEGSTEENRGQIIVAMEASGFSLKEERDGKMIFTANTLLRRILFLFEDVIVVEQNGTNIQIEGVRRGVVYVVYCLEGFIKNSKRGEE